MSDLNTLILRIHSSVLFIATIALTIVGGFGYYRGEGPFGIFFVEKIGYIGIFQAYMLMNVIAVVLFIGSSMENKVTWHSIGILAHVYPTIATLIFWDQLEIYGISPAGLLLHLPFIFLETYGIFTFKRKTRVIQ